MKVHLKFLLQSTLSNYLLLALKIAVMFFMTRWIFLGLEQADYGFWALLWSIFGYSLLLDFGFGTAIQKACSETLESQNWQRLNEKIATAFVLYCGMGLSIAGLTYLSTPYLGTWLQVEDTTTLTQYQQVYLLFGLGSALVFPTGFVTEVLRGLQRIHSRNSIQGIQQLIMLLAVGYFLGQGHGLMMLCLLSLGLNLLSNLAMVVLVKRHAPQIKLDLRLARFSELKGLLSFSVYAYIITLTNLLIFRTDQIVISSTLGVAWVALYQIANRVAELFRQFASQLHDGLGPLSARLFQKKGEAAIQDTLLLANRSTTLIAGLFFVPLWVNLKPLLSVWLNLNAPETVLCGCVLLFSMWIRVCFRSSSTQILLMSGYEKLLLILAIVESIANLGLSLFLVAQGWGILGVALGTLTPNLVLAFGVQLPLNARLAHMSLASYFTQSSLRSLLALLCAGALAQVLSLWFQADNLPSLFVSLCAGGSLSLLATVCIGLERKEQALILKVMRQKVFPRIKAFT